jgi:hypothetical protein
MINGEGFLMSNRPKIIYMIILLWLSLSIIFIFWGYYSYTYVVRIPQWNDLGTLIPPLHFGYLLSTIVWFIFSSLFILFAYGTFKRDSWAWTTGIIISTVFIIIFAFMLAALMINAILFFDIFSVYGLITVVLSFLANIGISFLLTRPNAKIYFNKVGS